MEVFFERFKHASKLSPPSDFPGWLGVLHIGRLKVPIAVSEDDLSHGPFRIPPEFKESGRQLVPDAEQIIDRLSARVIQTIYVFQDWCSKNLPLKETGLEALAILEMLNKEPLGDFIYVIRDHELLGWDGPRVKNWGEACERLQNLLGSWEKPFTPVGGGDGDTQG